MTACTSRSSAAPGRAWARSSPRSSPASLRGRSGCRCPSSSSSTCRRARPRRAGSRDPGAARASPGRNLGMDFLPGALPFRRRPPRRLRGRRRVVRHARDERRPHASQPEPARLGRADLAHRPRRRVLSPARRARRSRRPRSRACRCSPSTSCSPTPGRSKRPTSASRSARSKRPATAVALVPDGWLGATRCPPRGPGRISPRAPASAARLRRGGRACPPLSATAAVRLCRPARRAERRARRVAERRRRAVLSPPRLPRPAHAARRRAAGGVRARPRPRARARAPGPAAARRLRRAGRRRARRTRAVRALRLARGAVLDDHPAVAPCTPA